MLAITAYSPEGARNCVNERTEILSFIRQLQRQDGGLYLALEKQICEQTVAMTSDEHRGKVAARDFPNWGLQN